MYERLEKKITEAIAAAKKATPENEEQAKQVTLFFVQ